MIVADKFSISLQVLFIDKSVSINALTLVYPKSCEIVWLFYGFNFGFEETLEDIGQVTNIELIVEVNSSLPEISFDFILEIECSFDHTSNAILDSALEFSKVLIHECTENCEQGGCFWELNSSCPEMALEPWVDDERSSCWVHSSDIQSVVDIFEGEFLSVIPMVIVLMLSDKSNGCLSVIWIKSGHVQVINEIDELVLSNWSITCTCLPLELLFKLILKKSRVSVVIEVYNLLQVLLFCWIAKVIKETFSNLSLTATSLSNKHWRVVDFDKLLHKELGSDSIDSWNCEIGNWF